MAEEADQPFNILRRRCQEELLANKLHPAQAQTTESDLILEFREQGLHLFSFPLCVREGWCLGQLSGALPGGLMDMDGQIVVVASGALRLLRARAATLPASDVGMSSISDIQPDKVELLACGTTIAVAFGKIGETLGTVERVVLAENTVPSAHIGRDAPLP